MPPLHDTIAALRARDYLPAIWFVFSRRGCDEAAVRCFKGGMTLTTAEQAAAIEQELEALRWAAAHCLCLCCCCFPFPSDGFGCFKMGQSWSLLVAPAALPWYGLAGKGRHTVPKCLQLCGHKAQKMELKRPKMIWP